MYTTIVSGDTLRAYLTDPDWVIVDCRFSLLDPAAGRRAYLDGHIPGAVYADLDVDLAGPIEPDSGRHPLPPVKEFSERLERWGIANTTQVVVYDDVGGAIAARLWWMLRWVGHRSVALLDGGIGSWQEAGLALEQQEPTVVRTTFDTCVDDNLWVSTADVERGLADSSIVLVDARAQKRFNGETEPIDRLAGHVPGSINHPFDNNLYESGLFLAPEELRQRWSDTIADRPPAQVVAMCGSGVTACHELVGLEHAGLPGGKLYVGSWSEWIRNPDRPVATS